MNTDEINHLLKHLLANSRARFPGVSASDKLRPLNTIHSFVPCCYVSNIDPTGQCGSHWVGFFHSRTNRLEVLIVMEDNLVNSAFHFQNPFKYFIIPTTSMAFGTKLCGHFCIFVLFQRAHNYSLQAICK